jgi:hypothetical protein
MSEPLQKDSQGVIRKRRRKRKNMAWCVDICKVVVCDVICG